VTTNEPGSADDQGGETERVIPITAQPTESFSPSSGVDYIAPIKDPPSQNFDEKFLLLPWPEGDARQARK